MKRGNKLRRKRPLPTWGKVKTTCIVALLACNLLLLGVSAAGSVSDWALVQQTRSHMDSLLAQRGILCGSSVYRTLLRCPQAYSMRMDSSVQTAFAEALLTGTMKSGADKGNTTVWTAENGTIRWASSGAISANVTLRSQPAPTSSEDAEQIIRGMLRQAGISPKDEQISVGQQNTEYTVTVRQYVGSTELLGCSMVFTISEGNETTIDGVWCTGEAQPLRVRALDTYSPQQMIFQLADKQPSATEIISAQPAYVLSDKSGGRFTAIPCWRFSTNAGDFVMNIATGDVVASADIAMDIAETADDMGSGDEAFSE